VVTTEGQIVRFPNRWWDVRDLSNSELREWQAFAYQIWHDSIEDYAGLEADELAEGVWRPWLSVQAGPLEILNREFDRRSKAGAVVKR
jgi:hypothetical protein